LGAVKTNIGHTDCAAGVAGFIKTVLALEHRTLPPTLHFEQPNPETGLESSPFYVNAVLRDWPSHGSPRRAGVSSFGIGGTNAHVVLEEAPVPPARSASDGPALVLLSAKSGAALDRLRANLAAHVSAHPELSLADIACTLQEGRSMQPHRWAGAARDLAGLRASLVDTTGSPRARRATDRPSSVAFLFPGQGAQYAGMARALYAQEPVFRLELDRCVDAIGSDAATDLRSLLFPADDEAEAAQARLQQTQWAQPALFAVEYALAKQLIAWRVPSRRPCGSSPRAAD
jgi:acyl transferase domain-containing protein